MGVSFHTPKVTIFSLEPDHFFLPISGIKPKLSRGARIRWIRCAEPEPEWPQNSRLFGDTRPCDGFTNSVFSPDFVSRMTSMQHPSFVGDFSKPFSKVPCLLLSFQLPFIFFALVAPLADVTFLMWSLDTERWANKKLHERRGFGVHAPACITMGLFHALFYSAPGWIYDITPT